MMKLVLKYKWILFVLIASFKSSAQNLEKQERFANAEMREGNTFYKKENYADAEVSYKKSLATYPNNPKVNFNLANTMLQQKRYKEALTHYNYLAKSSKSNKMKAQSYHNMGNAYMGLNDYQKAVDAYKNSLRKNPNDEETRYNLALAQELLKQNQNQNKDNKDKQNKDNKNQNKDKKDDKNKDKEDDNKEKKEDDAKDKKEKDEKKNNENKDKPKDKENNKNKQENNKQQKPQPQPGKLTPQQAKQLLKALQNEEKKTQDKINAKRVKGQPIKTEKDW